LTIGDDITINEQWSVLLGVSDVTITTNSYNPDGDRAGHYNKSELTPTASVLFKPQPWITTYISYIEALEDGGTANDTFGGIPVINGGEAQEPLVSDQIEIGAKFSIGDVLLTAAVYDIDKPFSVYAITGSQAEYVQDGHQVHRGLEF